TRRGRAIPLAFHVLLNHRRILVHRAGRTRLHQALFLRELVTQRLLARFGFLRDTLLLGLFALALLALDFLDPLALGAGLGFSLRLQLRLSLCFDLALLLGLFLLLALDGALLFRDLLLRSLLLRDSLLLLALAHDLFLAHALLLALLLLLLL